MEIGDCGKKGVKLLKISRLLAPEYRGDLLAWVQLAYAAENSARKFLGFDTVLDSASSKKPQG